MIVYDTHLHSEYSHDSEVSLDDICKNAIAKGLKVVCTTEHIFLDKRDVGYGYFNQDSYLKAIRESKEKYKNQLILLSGIEFSEPHLFQNQLIDIKTYEFDMIVGAQHWLPSGFFGDPKTTTLFSQKQIVEKYYLQLYDMTKLGGFDTLAHMDLIKRYVKCNEQNISKIMSKVLKNLVNQKIALEINTSTIRKDNIETSPSYAIVDAYLNLGGQRLTIGSDAHILEDIGADFDQIPERFEPYIGFFNKREFIKSHI